MRRGAPQHPRLANSTRRSSPTRTTHEPGQPQFWRILQVPEDFSYRKSQKEPGQPKCRGAQELRTLQASRLHLDRLQSTQQVAVEVHERELTKAPGLRPGWGETRNTSWIGRQAGCRERVVERLSVLDSQTAPGVVRPRVERRMREELDLQGATRDDEPTIVAEQLMEAESGIKSRSSGEIAAGQRRRYAVSDVSSRSQCVVRRVASGSTDQR